MKAVDRSLSMVLHSGDQYVVPAFQRYYSWDKINWEKLWDDLMELYSDEPTKTHFMGSLVCMPAQHLPGVVTAYHLIDGQQRLVTLTLLLCAIRDLSSETGGNELAEEINENFLVHKHKTGQEHFKVYTRLRDRDAYSAIIENSELSSHVKETGMFGAYEYFRRQISAGLDDGRSFDLRGLFTTSTDRLGFVLINLEGDSPFKIFKSLNSTGVPLEESDLIRNYVFMQVTPNTMDAFDDVHWRPLEKMFEVNGTMNSILFSNFLRDFLMTGGVYVRKDETADTFESAFPAKGFDSEALVKKLIWFAQLHSFISGRSIHVSDRVEKSLRGLRELDVGTASPLVLLLLDSATRGNMTDEELIRNMEGIRGFVLRRYVCGESSRAYGRWFSSACSEFSAGGMDRVLKFLKDKKWPDDAKFSDALLKYDLYSSDYCHAVLRALEDAIPHKERADVGKAQAEHVMPRTLSEEWMAMLGPDHERIHRQWKDTIGNLTLTSYNPELGNRQFSEKKGIYADSGIQLNKYFSDKDRWTELEIEARGKLLTSSATRIFAGPPESLPEIPEDTFRLPQAEAGQSPPAKPVVSREQLGSYPPGEVAVFPSTREGVLFLLKYNAWAHVYIRRQPPYLALYVGAPDSEVQYFGEIAKIIEPSDPDSPIKDNYREISGYSEGKKLILLKEDSVKRLEKPVPFGRPTRRTKGLFYTSIEKLSKATSIDDL